MRIGFIGAGNMATALMEGMIKGGKSADSLSAYDISPDRMQAMRGMGVRTASTMAELAGAAEALVLAVKPQVLPDVLGELRALPSLPDMLSIVLGWDQATLDKALPSARGIAHAMPNTPSAVGEGVIAINDNHTIEAGRFARLTDALALCGQIHLLPERLFDAVTGISGSGPAYVYLFIEALADAGVRQGLPRPLAYQLAAQTAAGAGRMVLRTGEHPGALKDAVCSPGGSTIEAIYALEKAGFRAAVMDGVDACARKAAQAGKAK